MARLLAKIVVGASAGAAGALSMAALQWALRDWLADRSHTSSKPDSGLGFQALFRSEPGPAAIAETRASGQEAASSRNDFGHAMSAHLATGAVTGALYATVFRNVSVLRSPVGIPFGVVVWFVGAQIAVPALSLSRPAPRSCAAVQAFGFLAHGVFAAVLEVGCRAGLGTI